MAGFAFAAALAVVAHFIYVATGKAVSPVLCALSIGILWRNLIGVGVWAQPGLEFTSQTILRIGIALIGLRLTFLVLADTSLVAVPVVIACVTVALTVALGLGRLMGVPREMRQLLAAGTAICGATAIIAVAPLLRAKKADVGIALTCIVLFGSLAMMGYPWLAGAVFGDSHLNAGVFLGASIHDTSQVVGASLIYAQQFNAPDAVPIAGLTKFMRTLGLLVVVPLAAWWGSRGESAVLEERTGIRQKAIPGFVLFFIGFVILRTLGDQYAGASMAQWQAALAFAQGVSEWLLLIGMASVGLGVTFSHLREAGWRPILLSFTAAVLTGACGLALSYSLR